MKKYVSFVFFFSCVILIGCSHSNHDDSSLSSLSSDSISSSSEMPLSNYEKAMIALKNYDIESTNGYDYSLKQYIGKEVTNSDEIELRADFGGSIIARKIQKTKRLNEYGSDEQFTTTEITTYFNNNAVCEFKNGEWSWSNYKKSAYFATIVSEIEIRKEWLSSIKETFDENYVLSADVLDDKVNLFFDSSTSINSLSLKLTINKDISKFVSIELSYFQNLTRSEMLFSSYNGNVDITFPN